MQKKTQFLPLKKRNSTFKNCDLNNIPKLKKCFFFSTAIITQLEDGAK